MSFSARLDPVLDTLDKKVVEWKFSEYDKDTDNQLSRREVKSLRRLVKKFIKPRSCAKSFLKYCDSDENKFIERAEWSLCLGVDITSEYQLFAYFHFVITGSVLRSDLISYNL